MKQLIQAVKVRIKSKDLKKQQESQKQFVIDSNCLLEALLTHLSLDEINRAVVAHGLKKGSYLSAARKLRAEAQSRKNQPRK